MHQTEASQQERTPEDGVARGCLQQSVPAYRQRREQEEASEVGIASPTDVVGGHDGDDADNHTSDNACSHTAPEIARQGCAGQDMQCVQELAFPEHDLRYGETGEAGNGGGEDMVAPVVGQVVYW